MYIFQRALRLFITPMIFILPFWLTIGRAMLGSGGWGTLILFFTVAPFTLLVLLALGLLVRVERDGSTGKTLLSPRNAWLLAGLYVSIFLAGFFLVDGGDTIESIGSVATNVFGRGFEHISAWLSEIFVIVSMVIGIACFVLFIKERIAKRQIPAANPFRLK